MKKISILLALLPLLAVAQEPLGLDQYRQRVVEYSNQLKMSQANVRASEEKTKMTKTKFLPSIAATANVNYQVGNKISFGDISMQDYNYNANISLQQVVWGGGGIRAQHEAAKIDQLISELSGQQALENVVYGADLTYWAFAASAEQYDVMEQYVSIIKSLYGVVDIRFKDGYVSKTDMLMVETRLNEAEIQRIAAQKLYLTSLHNLNKMLGQHTVTKYSLKDSVAVGNDMIEFKTLEDALINRPEYHIADLNIEMQNTNLKLARSKFNPQFVMGVQGVFGTPSLNFTGEPKLYGVAFAQLNVPIFNWGERRYSVNMVRSAITAMEYSKKQVADDISGEMGIARVGIEQSYAQVKVSTNNLAIAAENLSLNTFSYSEGRLPILDVLQSQLAWIQSYTAYVNSNYQYKVAIADYKKALGATKFE